jgi:hypothetical protein
MMKKKKHKTTLSTRNFANDFTRGALMSILLDTLAQETAPVRPTQRMARAALQGGLALATATVAADMLQQRCYLKALTVTVGAAAGIYALQRALPTEYTVTT